MMNNKITVVDLFAGVGGLSKAFKEAGAEIVWANEFNESACKIYRANFSDVDLVQDDIRRIEVENIPNNDILIGGFPGPFAMEMKGNSEGNINIFLQIIRILKEKKPKAFLLETSEMYMHRCYNETFITICNILKVDLGYYIKYKVLNSLEYGNIPINKKRMYIVGFIDEKKFNQFEFPEEIQLTTKISDFINFSDKKEEKYYKGYDVNFIKREMGAKIKKHYIYEKYPSYINRNIPDIFHEIEYSSFGMGNFPLLHDDFDIRSLTNNECFDIVGYNDIYIPKDIMEHKLYWYVSLCSSVPVVRRIAENILSAFKDEKSRSQSVTYNNNIDKLISKLNVIKPGNEHAKVFHDYIFEVVQVVFQERGSRFYKEKPIHDQTKRVDIIFDNTAKEGFFCELNTIKHIPSQMIIIECKNYNEDISNPEFDQLLGRFGKAVGWFGIIICRNIQDREKIIKRSKTAFYNDKGVVMVLCDEDIRNLLLLFKKGDLECIDLYLKDIYDEFIIYSK